MTSAATTQRLHNLATFLINYRYAVVSLFVVITLGMITSLLPAWRASQKRPVEAIART